MAAAEHPIFDDIYRGDLEAVKQHVLAEPAVLEEKRNGFQMTPLMYAIDKHKPAIAQWLIDHRGPHDVDTRDLLGVTALHHACVVGPLSTVEALVASGADPAATGSDRMTTPLITAASTQGHSDIVAYLLQLPAVRATVDHACEYGYSSLSEASRAGSAACVQLLLDACADPTIPAGDMSPLNRALRGGHTDVAALLRHAISEPDRARALHKAWSLIDAPRAIAKAQQQRRRMHTRGQQKRAAVAAAPVYLKGRVQRDEALPLPVPELAPQQQGDERVRATVAFVLGLEDGGVAYAGLPQEVYVELLGYLLPAWADKGPGGQQQ